MANIIKNVTVASNDAWNKSISNALYEVLANFPAEDGARLARLHRYNLALRIDCLKGLPDTNDGATRAHSTDHKIRDNSCW